VADDRFGDSYGRSRDDRERFRDRDRPERGRDEDRGVFGFGRSRDRYGDEDRSEFAAASAAGA
jgi:hypothetical protein